MGISILELVLRRLREAKFTADVAFPGQKFPQITKPVAAVHIEKVDRANMTVTVEGNEILVTRPNDEKENRSLHGLSRTLIHNMVIGVTEGYKKTLEVNGVGYRAQKQGNNLVMNLGFSHQVIVSEVPGIKIDVPNANTVVISGPDKQQVGQFAAEVREKRPPEPYKGKGIKYDYEVVRRKEGKAGKGSKK